MAEPAVLPGATFVGLVTLACASTARSGLFASELAAEGRLSLIAPYFISSSFFSSSAEESSSLESVTRHRSSSARISSVVQILSGS